MSSRLVLSLLLVAISIVLVWAFRPPPGNADSPLPVAPVADQGRAVDTEVGLG
ncbi:hypothetical protein [Ensifer canadensis]